MGESELVVSIALFCFLLKMNCFEIIKAIITPADEKTHGFNRVDDSPQIFNYVQMYILKISTRYAILNL